MSNSIPNDLRERITALVDGQVVSDVERAELEAQVASSDPAQTQFRVETALVRMLHARRSVLRERIPVDVERRLRSALAEEMATKASFWQQLVRSIARPMVAIPVLAASLAIGVFIVAQRSTDAPVESVVAQSPLVDLQAQAYANFQAIVRGELSVAVSSDSKEELQTWFKGNGVAYDVQFPSIEASLVGGVVSTHEHKKFAHLVYSVGDHLVYMFEVDEPSITSKEVALDARIVDDLAQSRWHWEERADTGTAFIWKSNNVVCVAVSDLRTEELSALFNLNLL